MVSMDTTQKFSITLATIPAGSQIDGPPSYHVDTPGIVTITASADGLSASVAGVAAGTCTITPSALANAKPITGSPVQVTVKVPVVFATALEVTVGPVVPQ